MARGEADLAVAWGPIAGYFAARQRAPMRIAPVRPEFDPPNLPMQYDISMGVRRGDQAFKREIETVLERRRAEIRAILSDYGVPLVDAATRQARP